MSKGLLIETQLFEAKISEQGGKTLVSGVIQRAGAKNQNGRVYPRAILEREVRNYQKLINERRALGELDHPDSSVINLKNVSHNITEIHWEGDDLVGTLEILPTPSGNIAKELLKSGISLGISSRGMGSTKEKSNGTSEVQEDFEILGWDLVSNPSTHGAFVSPIQEGVNVQREAMVCTKYCKSHDLMREIIIELS